jgi:hypothetical protein
MQAMTSPKTASWSNRRWKIFENVYDNNPDFQANLRQLHESYPDNNQELEDFLMECGIPLDCKQAITMYLNHPDLNRDEYLEFVQPPMMYWNAEAGYMGPDYPSPASYFRHLCEDMAEELGTNDFLGVDYRKLDFEALAQLFSGDGTVINFTSYMDITDARNLMSIYKNEIELLLKYRSERKDKAHPAKLAGRVFGFRNNKQRDELIMRLTEEGKKPKDIAKILVDEDYGDFTEEYIRQIKSRERKRNSI